MQRFFKNESKKVTGNLNTKCTLSAEAEANLRWWVANMEVANGKMFLRRVLTLISAQMRRFRDGGSV
jgi:hypothetical protein